MSKFQVPEFNFDFGGGFLAYDYQQETFKRCIEHMRTSNDPAYVYASVSAGKSLLVAMIAKHFQNVNKAASRQGFKSNHKVLMLVRTGELVKQNAEEAWNIDCANSIWCAGLGLKRNAYGCLMASEKSFYNSMNKELKDFAPSVLLIDEAHMLNDEDGDTQMQKIIAELRERKPNLKIIGLTGSPWRGQRKMLDGDFWQKELIRIDRPYLTERGFVMPVEFGFGTGAAHYDHIGEESYSPDEEGDQDFTKSQLDEMEKLILKEGTRTQQIMLDVMKHMQTRNCALITLSGIKHCKEAAKYLPKGSYAIIDQNTSTKDRIKIKEACNRGEIKYVLQIGVWTVGVSIPRIDTIVIMRLIGSMVLYEQLVGRGVRKLKQHDIDAGIIKNECLVLDYTDTSAVMASLFSNDELDRAENARAKANDEDLIECPKCGHENSPKARRCSNVIDGARCEFFFNAKICDDLYGAHTGRLIKKGCGVENDPSAKTCRSCGGFMKDPNEKLLNQAYTNEDLIPVQSFSFGLTRAGDKVLAAYKLANGASAREIFDIGGKEKWKRATWIKFVREHVSDPIKQKSLIACRDPKKTLQFSDAVRRPLQVTHRKNDKSFDILARKVFE
ncbi:helicase [Vibrio phage BUCT006]|nr:helicase [Vibrio phage BUCT006]